jgi:hypothetical protein
VAAILKMATASPELIPDIEKFLALAIFKMAAKIQHYTINDFS